MNKEILKKAQELAKRPYSVILSKDELSDGSIVYLARNPEIRGCKAQGDSQRKAIDNLFDARVDNIYFLLEDGREIPLPSNQSSMTGTHAGSVSIIATINSNSQTNLVNEEVDWDNNQESVFTEFVSE